jgi:predicted permease
VFREALASIRKKLRRLDADAEIREEVRFHVAMETERLIRERGLDEREARRQAHVRFGGAAKYTEAVRDTFAWRWIDRLSLDARLGARMLVKHRGLTLAGGFALAVAIAVGATFFEIVGEAIDPALPIDGGDRVVALNYVDAQSGQPERRVLRDFLDWRGRLTSFDQLAAFRTVPHNLMVDTAPPEPIKVAEITSSAFAIAGTPPLLGRYLLPSDERTDASHVLVIGYRAWRSRFGGDPGVVGRTVTLGGAAYAIAGVMPEGFRFPIDHEFWAPLRTAGTLEPLEGPEIFVFGRIGAGVPREAAQAELNAAAQQAAAARPEPYSHLRPAIVPYTHEHLDLTEPGLIWLFRTAQLLVGAVLLVVAVNLAILVYARTTTRLGELAMRTALGASRPRILLQLFVEACALAAVGAAAGLLLAGLALGRAQTLARFNGSLPFWIRLELSPSTVMYAVGLALLAAAIMGVLPGLKATGRPLIAHLRDLSGAARLGRTWTVLIVGQVAAAVAVLPASVYLARQVAQMELAGPGFAAADFVVATIAPPEDGRDRRTASAVWQRELLSRVAQEPGVTAVTFSSFVPGYGPGREIVMEHEDAGRRAPAIVSRFDVDVDLFAAYRAHVLAGRAFTTADPGFARTVVVNRSFVEAFLKDRPPLGARFRYARPDGAREWYEIVGVVRDFPDFPEALSLDTRPNVYHAAVPGAFDRIVLSVRFGGPPPPDAALRLRALAAQVDTRLQVSRVSGLADFYGQTRAFWRYLAWGAGLLTTCVLLLSAAGIYALMSFTVAQRTREIGIRAALGAEPRRIVASVFAKASAQLGLGLLAGSAISAGALSIAGVSAAAAGALLASVAVTILVVGLLSAYGPARRCLRIQPIDVLKAE